MSKIKVLIVDDANFMRELVRKAVRTLFPGFVLRDAADGNQAKGMIQQETFDLILCDWEMPKMSGDELLGWVRNESDCKDVPFILVTSRGDKDHVVKAVQLKANNYIVKPFSNDKLTGVVSKVLTQSKGISAKELMTLGGAPATAFQGKNSVDILTQSATKITTPTKITHPPQSNTTT
ncbi:MAG: response regulator [Methylococcales bacterium]|jgi:DNA-binding response OmpR family regulator|nr:response regulator [Methylococcales bacterium]MBT7410996.1 response regulator [Methylococcales bacterium]